MEYYSDDENDLDKLVDDEAGYGDVSGDEAIEDNSHNIEEGGEFSAAPPPKPVKAKKVVLNPQPKLNFEALQGPKGLLALNELFKDQKFRGSGHEKEDMGNLLKKLEQWAYRLYPKFHFEDSLKRLEVLGKKREVQVYLRKIRTGMLDNDVVRQLDDDDDDSRDAVGIAEPLQVSNSDAFDDLLSDQIARTQGTPQGSSRQFDDLLSDQITRTQGTPQGSSRQFDDLLSDQIARTQGPSRLPDTPFSGYSGSQPMGRHPDTPRPVLTEEQLARIEKNRKMAMEKKLQKVVESPPVIEVPDENAMECSEA